MSDVTAPTHASCLVRVFAITLVFVVAGPPVGAVAFMTSAALSGMIQGGDVSGLGWVALFALIYAVPFSYFFGIIPAAAAGLLVGIRQAYFGPATWPYMLGTGLLVGFGTLFLLGQQTTIDPGSPVPIILATCLVPTFLCWLAVRGWHVAHTLAGQHA